VLDSTVLSRAVTKPAQLPRNDQDQCARQMQSLSLDRSQDSTAWDSGPGARTSAASTQEQHADKSLDTFQFGDSNQYSDYDPNRDSTAQPMSAWQNQNYGYYDPSAYGYNDYGEYYDEEAYCPEAGDDWDQLGFAAEPECTQHPENEYCEAASDKKPAGRRKPSEQALCSQYQVSGDCPRGTDCHMTHGDLCQVSAYCISCISAYFKHTSLPREMHRCTDVSSFVIILQLRMSAAQKAASAASTSLLQWCACATCRSAADTCCIPTMKSSGRSTAASAMRVMTGWLH